MCRCRGIHVLPATRRVEWNFLQSDKVSSKMRTHAIRISIPRLNPSQCREIINIHSRKLCRRNWWWIISAGNISMRVSRDNAQPTRELRGIKGLRVEACVAREPSYQHSSREYYSEVNHFSLSWRICLTPHISIDSKKNCWRCPRHIRMKVHT